jgi:hypothetical protein
MSKPDVEDFLTEDPEIPSQRFVLLSFLSPEKVLARKDLFFFDEFLKDYEVEWKTKNLEKFLAEQVKVINDRIDEQYVKLTEKNLTEEAEVVRKSKIPVDMILTAYQDYVKANAKEISLTKIKDAWDEFEFKRGKELEDKFYAKNEFKTTVRGLKIRGVFGSQEEAVAKSKKLQRNDPIHNIFVGEIGKWLPWDPNPKDIVEQEYAEDQLNQLMKGYKNNEESREKFYSEHPNLKKQADKKVVTSMVEGDVSATNAIFNGPADLAIERKMAAKGVVAAVDVSGATV